MTEQPYGALARAWRDVDAANVGRKTMLAEAYTLLCSTEPALIRAVRDAPNPDALRLNQLLLDKVREWIGVYREILE